MGKTRIIPIILLIALSSCRSNESKSDNEFYKVETLINSKSLKLSAVFLDSINFRFQYLIDNKEGQTKIVKLLPSGLPSVEWYSNKWVFLKGGCGSSCFYGYLIPLNLKDTLKMVMFPTFSDQSRHLIVYCDEDKLVIENFLSGKSIQISDENLNGPYCSFNIDKIRIDQKNLIIELTDKTQTPPSKIDISRLIY